MPRPDGNNYRGKSGLDREIEAAEALHLRMMGNTPSQVAEMMGLDYQVALKRIRQGLAAKNPTANVESWRAIHNVEWELMRVPMRQKLADPNGEFDDKVQAVNALLRVQKRQAEMLGLDRAPAPMDDLLGKSEEELDEIIAALSDKTVGQAEQLLAAEADGSE